MRKNNEQVYEVEEGLLRKVVISEAAKRVNAIKKNIVESCINNDTQLNEMKSMNNRLFGLDLAEKEKKNKLF